MDSGPARQLPEDERVLVRRPEIENLNADELAKTIRVRMRRFGQEDGVTGGNSTKQIRFDFDLRHSSVVQSLALRKFDHKSLSDAPSEHAIERLTVAEQRQVTALHIRQAVDRLLAGEDAKNFADSNRYDLITSDGQRLPPKKVFGLALETALGIEAFPGHFSAGWGEPSFELIQDAGYEIVDKDETARFASNPSVNLEIPADPEERSWAEGNERIARHLRTERRRASKASAEKRNQVRAAYSGRLACENPNCTTDWYAIFPTAIAESVFEIHHTIPVATMQDGHQTKLADLLCLCASCHRAEHRRLALQD